MASDALKVDVTRGGSVMTLTFNRPQHRNAINRELAYEFRDQVEAIRRDPTLRVVVLRGAGEHFCAGDDITGFPEFNDGDDGNGAASFMMREVASYQDTARALEEMEKVVVAAVDGNCIGGGLELTMVSDIVVATDRALFGIPEIDIDLTPGWGGTSRLSRYVGRRKVKEMVLLGTLLDAEEAERFGLVNRVVGADELDSAVEDVVDILLEKRPTVLKLMKFITGKGWDLPTDGALSLELLSAILSWTTGEGSPIAPPAVRAFIEKSPVWADRRKQVRDAGWSS